MFENKNNIDLNKLVKQNKFNQRTALDEQIEEIGGMILIKTGCFIRDTTKQAVINIVNFKSLLNYKSPELYIFIASTLGLNFINYKYTAPLVDKIDTLLSNKEYFNTWFNTHGTTIEQIIFGISCVLPFTGYFFFKGMIDNHTLNKYNKQLSTLLNGKAILVKTFKENNNLVYQLDSRIALDNYNHLKNEIEHTLKTTVLKITYTKNKEFINLITNSQVTNNIDEIDKDDKIGLINAMLNNINIDSQYIDCLINDYVAVYRYKLKNSVKALISRKNDIATTLKISQKHFDIVYDDETGTTNFEFYNKNYVTYFLEDYINKVDLKMVKDMVLPALMGIDMRTGGTVIEDIYTFPHALIMGATGSGKSSMINCLIQSSMWFNTNVYYILVDFKIVELSQYKEFKNVHFISDMYQFSDMIKNLEQIIFERQQLFATINVKNLRTYNDVTGENIPYVVMLIDESADLSIFPDKKLVNEISTRLNGCINKARALGISIIESLQRADYKQLDTSVRSQLTGKIGFSVAEKEDSQFVGFNDLTDLKRGEYRIKTPVSSTRKIKSFYIEDNITKVLKNKVYETLYKRNVGKEYVYYQPKKAKEVLENEHHV